GLRLYVHGLGFGFAFLEDDLGFGLALRARAAGMTFSFGDDALLLGGGQRFDALALDFSRLQHGGDQLALAAQDLGILHFDLLLFLHLLDFDRLRHYLLLHHVGLDLVSFVRLRLLPLDSFQICGFLDFEIARRLGLLGLRSRLRRDA